MIDNECLSDPRYNLGSGNRRLRRELADLDLAAAVEREHDQAGPFEPDLGTAARHQWSVFLSHDPIMAQARLPDRYHSLYRTGGANSLSLGKPARSGKGIETLS